MANFHCPMKTISRGGGRQVVAAAAYRSGAVLTDERTGESMDYRRLGGRVAHTEIIVPAGSPAWAHDRERLWNEAEKAEDKSTRRATATTAREVEISLPHELDADQRIAATRAFARHLVDTYGVAADIALHDPHKGQDERNYHAHILISDRRLTDAGFGGKVRELNVANGGRQEVEDIRATWAGIGADALAAAGYELEAVRFRVSHFDLPTQRKHALERGDLEWADALDRRATVHLGPEAAGIERRGEASELGDVNRDIRAENAAREKLRAEAAATSAQIIDLAAAREQRAADRAERAAIRTFDPARILEQITERKSTFTRADLNYALSKEITDAKERAAMNSTILARPEVVGLRETADGPVTRYTTRAVLDAERDVLSDAAAMAKDTSHGLTARQQAETLDRYSHLDQEQRAAFAHLTGPEGIAVLVGEAGTGKSTVLAAVRDAYEDAGYRVIGTAWTNSVVDDMRRDGFKNATTVQAELFRLENGRSQWDARTVVIIDEAAMLSTKHLAAVIGHAEAAGAKVIGAGDDKQLPSIERGGVFGAINEERPAAELHTVRRVQSQDEQAAFNLMHKGDFRAALEIFDRRGAIHWTQTQDEARAALVERYSADMAADPTKSRFVFTNSNAEVARLNQDLRALRRERGDLGEDHRLQSKDGPQDFAKGDRIMFTGSAYGRDAKALGLFNGNVGTVEQIEGDRLTVALDSKGGKPRIVAFTVGENAEAGEFNAIRHGYAGTIYKGQGKTLDQTYVLNESSLRAASSYVGLTRHRESLALFTARGAEAWVEAKGGVEGLTPAQHKSAAASYARWSEAAPELAKRHGFADYVGYVQEQQSKRPPDHSKDLDALARQMGRVEEHRAASQFHHDAPAPERPTDRGESFGNAARDTTGRPPAPTGGDGATKVAEPAQGGPTAQQRAEAQHKAAIIGRATNPAKVAQALRRAHMKDAGRGLTEDERPASPSTEDKKPARSSLDAMAEVVREAAKEQPERPDHKLALERYRGRTR